MNNRSIFQSFLISLFFAIPLSVVNILILVAKHNQVDSVSYLIGYVIAFVGLLVATLALSYINAPASVRQATATRSTPANNAMDDDDEADGEVEEEDEDESSNDGKEVGTVKWFDGSKGYGFIQRSNGEDVFVHFRSIRGRGRRFLVEGQKVKFRISKGDKGPQAEDVIRIRNKKAA